MIEFCLCARRGSSRGARTVKRGVRFSVTALYAGSFSPCRLSHNIGITVGYCRADVYSLCVVLCVSARARMCMVGGGGVPVYVVASN